ncbi:MAG: SDR family NAD(P)-dependent oxidoreductase [Rhizorhabdus sp.]
MHQDFTLIGNPGGYANADTAVAVVGMSCRFAKVRGLDEYWALLRDAREAIDTFSDETLLAAGVTPEQLRDPHYVPRGAPLDDMECFDATLFGLSPRDAAIMDPQHRHFLECAWEALENAGHTPKGFGGVIGVFAGSGHNAYMPLNLMSNPSLVRDVGPFLLRHTSNDKDFLTTRVSYLLDLKGPSLNVQTACSTSLVSVHLAVQSLLGGECDMALAGGASIELPHRRGYLFEEGEILSPDGRCRPFDIDSQGTVFGSGAAIVALRRLEDALAGGDHIYAVVRGSAINNDGAGKVGYLAPSVDGQAKVIAEALAIAGCDADTIGYVEAHGTGTPVGDPIEVAALTAAFRQTTDRVGGCAIGSVKGNIGHTDTAAGTAGLVKVALALHHRTLPASLNFAAPNPACAFEESPFQVQAETAAWASPAGQPRRAGISSLGVGGTNAHVVVEEAPAREPSGPSRARQLLLCSARTETVADANAAALARHLAETPDADLADAAYTLAMGRQHLPHRRFAVAGTAAEAAETLARAPDKPRPAAIPGRGVAFLFCGAGQQHVDMARGLYDTEPGFRGEVDKALAVLDGMGSDVRRWLFPSKSDRAEAASKLERPSIALPALFVIQTALARFWMGLGIEPGAMIGHSSGEYAAAHLAGVIDLEAGLRVVSTRGRLFETIGNGAMLSVPLAEAELLPLLPPDLSIATINAPKLCVVSGAADAIGRFHRELEAREIEAQVVRISVAAHSPMLDPILPEFRALMRMIELRAPAIPFASNRTGDWVTAADVTDPEYWVRHLRETVRFTDGLQRLLDDPERVLLEVGPGRGIGSLVRQHLGRESRQPVLSSLRHPDQAIADDVFTLGTLGELWALGVEIDWAAYWAGEKRLRVPLPTYQFARQRHWIEPGALVARGVDDDAPLVRHADPARWQYEPVWTRTALPGAAVPEGPALVLADEGGLGASIAETLRAAGREVVVVRPGGRFRRVAPDRFTLGPANTGDYARLLDCLSAEGRLPAQIYHCWLVGGSARPPRGERLPDLGMHSLIALAPELARQLGDAPVEVALITDRAQRVGDERGLLPLKASGAATARVVATEFPSLRVRTVDVALPSPAHARGLRALGEALVGELAGAAESRPIAYRAGERWVLDHRALAAPSSPGVLAPTALRGDATYVVTGGLGGLGLTIARHLAETHGARVALIARTGLPPREQWGEIVAHQAGGVGDAIRKVLALEAAGARVELVVADVANPRAMRAAIKRIEARLGPIAGVFHAAGTLDDGLIEGKTRASIAAVLRPKIAGTLALEAALRGRPPEFLVLFSSVSAFAGLAGQADYAAANAFLDAYAQARHDDPQTQVLSIGWSQWGEVGMAAALNRGAGGSEGLADDLGECEAVDHQFLDRLHRLSPDEHVVCATLTPERHWLLDEHRLVNGGPLLPGTGYLELARAAHALVDPGPVVLSEVTFLSPFAVADGEARELRIRLHRRVGGDWRFVVLGRAPSAGSNEWVEHATGTVGPGVAGDHHARLDRAAIAARCAAPRRGPAVPDPVIRFGRRWANVREMRLGADEALLDLTLDPAFHGDFAALALHPALLDFATAGAQELIRDRVPGRDFFAPFSYRRVVQHAPLPPAIVSHVRYRAPGESPALMAVFDVTIADPEGRVLVEVSEFAMMRVRDPGVLSAPASAQAGRRAQATTTMARNQLEAIAPAEGVAVIEALLAGPARPHVVVSPHELAPALARLREPPRRAPARTVEGEESGDLPATAAERLIAELWSDLLGVDPVRRDDDFFDLGGHSLLAVQFTNRLRKRTGRTLPLGALLDAPTVARLAAVIDPEGAAAAEPRSNAGEAPPQQGIVPVRPGGSLTPIFFVHDGLGETLLYRGLALRLDPNRPIYGIEPLRAASGSYAHTRIQEMASEYVERVRRVQPVGPYLLAGLCAGGVIAFEMARQLQELGERVAFVGIIDAADVAAAKRPFHITRARLSRVRASLRRTGALDLLPALAGKAVNAVRWEIRSRLDQARDRRAVAHLRAANDGAGPVTEAAAADLAFLKLYEVAHRLHRPEGLFDGGRVVVFKASDDRAQGDDLPYRAVYSDIALGWGRRVAGEVIVADVPGGHSSALQDPNVETLARLFQEAVDGATEPIGLTDPGAAESAPYELVMEAAE